MTALIVLITSVAGVGGTVAASASGTTAKLPPNAPAQEKQLFATCRATVGSMQAALKTAATNPVRAIQSQLQVSTPGTLSGRLGFNRSGTVITFVGDRGTKGAIPARTTYTCGAAATDSPGLGPGATREVATLQRTFTQSGTYTLTFKLNATGQRILGQLARADRGYRRHNPHGNRPPAIAVGVSLAYTTG